MSFLTLSSKQKNNSFILAYISLLKKQVKLEQEEGRLKKNKKQEKERQRETKRE